MTQEEKFLLLQDLCARLPYHCRVFYEYVDDLDGKTYGYSLTLNTWCINEFNANKAVVKPYLLPMSSMTEKEKKDYELLCDYYMDDKEEKHYFNNFATLDWMNQKHFDYRGLIKLGLALEAPKGMYNKKEGNT